jgi:hypothetical protein
MEIIGLGRMAKKTGKNEYRYEYWELNHNKTPIIFKRAYDFIKINLKVL